LPLKSLIVDYQQVTKSLIFAIFATKGNLARKYCKIRVKKNGVFGACRKESNKYAKKPHTGNGVYPIFNNQTNLF
jgi:hypothetical protein